jgi:drug/metabolite transporter (DMT)-like permease
MNPRAPAHGRRLGPLLLAWALLLAAETLGQIALRTAGLQVGVLEPDRASVLAALSTPWLWLGLVCYLSQFAVWMAILERSSLSAAFPTSAIAFVAIMIVSWAWFGDPMGWQKILGSVIIVAGILLLGSNAQAGPPVSARNSVEVNP